MFTVVPIGQEDAKMTCDCGWSARVRAENSIIRFVSQEHIMKFHSPHIEQLSFVDYQTRPLKEYKFNWDGKDKVLELDGWWG